ncbi:unnamed protein product, partial [Didymodactylos carnosus]
CIISHEQIGNAIDFSLYIISNASGGCTEISLFSDYLSACSKQIENLSRNAIDNIEIRNLCVQINLSNLQTLTSIKWIKFENCTVEFYLDEKEVKNTSFPEKWTFNNGRTTTFSNLIQMINHLNSWVELNLTECFGSIHNFDNFIPLATGLTGLTIQCDQFEVDQPSEDITKNSIYSTIRVLLDLKATKCPNISAYQWLGAKRGLEGISRTLKCEQRTIKLISESWLEDVDDNSPALNKESNVSAFTLSNNKMQNRTTVADSKFFTSIRMTITEPTATSSFQQTNREISHTLFPIPFNPKTMMTTSKIDDFAKIIGTKPKFIVAATINDGARERSVAITIPLSVTGTGEIPKSNKLTWSTPAIVAVTFACVSAAVVLTAFTIVLIRFLRTVIK